MLTLGAVPPPVPPPAGKPAHTVLLGERTQLAFQFPVAPNDTLEPANNVTVIGWPCTLVLLKVKVCWA